MTFRASWRPLPAILPALFALISSAQAQTAPPTLALATASPGGVYTVYGDAWAQILSRHLQIEVTPQASQGAVQNVILLEKRAVMLAFINMGPTLHGWNGSGWAKGVRYRSMRVMFPMYDTTFQFAAHKRVAAKTLGDFAGLRIGAGPRGGTSGTYVEQVFKTLGIAAGVRHGAWDNLISQMADRELDGAVASIGAPFPVLSDLDNQQLIDFIEPSEEQVAVVRSQIPEITPSVVTAGTYRSMSKDYRTMGLYNFAVAHKDLPDDLVYRITKITFDNQQELVKAHAAAKETVAANIERNTFLPIHPGALRYYREIGIAVPAIEAPN